MSRLSCNDEDNASTSSGESSWEDAEPDQENLQIVSLFDDKAFPSVKAMFEHCKQQYNFDILALQRRLGL